MLAVNESAIELIRRLRSRPDVPDDAAVRIAPREEDAAELNLAFARAPHEGDQVIEADDVRVFVEHEAALALEDKTLDARVDEQGRPSFQITEQQPW